MAARPHGRLSFVLEPFLHEHAAPDASCGRHLALWSPLMAASDAPPPPPTDEEDERWVDVTEDVAGVAASLDVDELLRAPTFSLYDSMSALN